MRGRSSFVLFRLVPSSAYLGNNFMQSSIYVCMAS